MAGRENFLYSSSGNQHNVKSLAAISLTPQLIDHKGSVAQDDMRLITASLQQGDFQEENETPPLTMRSCFF